MQLELPRSVRNKVANPSRAVEVNLLKFELNCVFCAHGSRVIGANMRYKLFVALQLEVAHHFIERFAGGRTSGLEPPTTFGATKTLKTLFLNP
jgi:hypothetical protein